MSPEKADRIRLLILGPAIIWILCVVGKVAWYAYIDKPKLDATTEQKIADIKREGKLRRASITKEGGNCLDKGGMPVIGFSEGHVICVDRKALIHVYEETKDQEEKGAGGAARAAP